MVFHLSIGQRYAFDGEAGTSEHCCSCDQILNKEKDIVKEKGAGSISKDTVAGGVMFACKSSYRDFKTETYGAADEVYSPPFLEDVFAVFTPFGSFRVRDSGTKYCS